MGFMLLNLTYGINSIWILVCYILLGIASGAGPIFSSTIKELNPVKATGTAIGLQNAICYIAVALVTSMAGFIMDFFSDQTIRTPSMIIYPRAAYRTIFTVCFVMALFSFFLSFFIRESYGKGTHAKEIPSIMP
jgi:MFS family permease